MTKNNNDEKSERKKRKKERKKEARKKTKLNNSETAVTTANSDAQDSNTLERKQVELSVSLFPAALGDVLQHVKESIRSLLLKYSNRVGGVLLAFDHVKLLDDANGNETHGVIINEMPHIHYRVQMDALVFCPTQGAKLKGTINECFPSHVGLLVNSFFNAMVSSEELEAAGYVFDQDLCQWIVEGSSKALGTDDTVIFTVQKLHECAGAISMEGSHPEVVPVD